MVKSDITYHIGNLMTAVRVQLHREINLEVN